ncbi:Ctr86p [Rhodotorula paludigena]|uniref:Ctr86p n=1 Tax=Rhodotorula paludigena TaxID=86838 RepID=UPI00317BEFE4
MQEPRAPNAAELVQSLEEYTKSQHAPDQLVQLLRPPRLALRSTPDFRTEYGSHSAFWPALAAVWKVEAARLANDEQASVPAVLALAAFLLSLCMQAPQNQIQAVDHVEPHLRTALFAASSLTNLQDPAYADMTRTCCQALANLVASNETTASRFADRLQLEEQTLLIQRLLATPDHGTMQALLIFLLNSIHGSRERALLLGTSKPGAAILDRLMMLISVLFEDENPESMSTGEYTSEVFGLSFSLVQQLIHLGALAQAYEEHALMPGYSISATLVVLLKFLDGHLSLPGQATSLSSVALVPFLLRQLAHLSSSLIDEGAQRARNAADAATFQGIVLVLHCLCSIGLALEQEREEADADAEEEARNSMNGGIEAVARLLHFSQTLLPPPSARPAPPPSPHATPSTADAPVDPPTTPSAADIAAASALSPESIAAIAQLQRTAVQYLGIVTFLPPFSASSAAKSRVEEAQRRVKENGGLEVLLGLCQIDERNPTMREHALFAIRNVLKNNQANQNYVEAMKPQYKVGNNGELLDLPPPKRNE